MRWDLEGRKEIRFASWCKNLRTRKSEWRMRGLARPRPLFNLHRLFKDPDKPVLMFEGCRKADRAAALFPNYVCTAFPNGAGAVANCDLEPLYGRKLVIWPDADEPGESFAYSLGFALKDHCAEIEEVDVEAVYRVCAEGSESDVPSGWDVVDALSSKADREELSSTVRTTLRPLDLDIERPDGRSFIKVGGATLTPDRGLLMLVWRGSGRNRVQEEVWVSGPFEVLGQSRDKVGGEWGIFLSWKDNDGREHAECVPRGEVFGDPKKLSTKLVAEGFPLIFGYERLLAQFLTMVRPKARVTEVTNTGWHEVGGQLVFVLPSVVSLMSGVC